MANTARIEMYAGMMYLTIAPETGVVQPTIIAMKAEKSKSVLTILLSFRASFLG